MAAGLSSHLRAYYKLKEQVLRHYSPAMRCEICGIGDVRCLSLDHIDGGGLAHRRRMGGSTYRVYASVRNDGFPAGFRVLCMNCQFVERVKLRSGSQYSRWSLNLRLKALQAYSPRLCCDFCGHSREPSLTIDHVDGGGKRHRASISKGRVRGRDIYQWLKTESYPLGFRVLCMNCQVVRYKTKDNM